MNRWVGVTLTSLAAGAVGLGLALKFSDQSRIETKIEKLKCELLNK